MNKKLTIVLALVLVAALACKRSAAAFLSDIGGWGNAASDQQSSVNQIVVGSADAYAKECALNGVVLPKPLDDNSFWTETRQINDNYAHFAAGTGSGTMFLHSEEKGGCIQLRATYRNDSESLAKPANFAICWSAAGSVCFWEHRTSPTDVLGPGKAVTSADSATLASQPDNECTACHRGDNPFVGHGENGDPTFNDFPSVKFTKPVVPNHWVKSEGWESMQKGDETYQCAGACHSIPKLSKDDGFCGLGIQMNMSGYMLGPRLKIRNISADFNGSGIAVGDLRPTTSPIANIDGTNAPSSLAQPPGEPASSDSAAAEIPMVAGVLDPESQDLCQKYLAFLQACGTEIKKNDVGICAVLVP